MLSGAFGKSPHPRLVAAIAKTGQQVVVEILGRVLDAEILLQPCAAAAAEIHLACRKCGRSTGTARPFQDQHLRAAASGFDRSASPTRRLGGADLGMVERS